MTHSSIPSIDRFRVRAIRLPMREPHQTASGTVSESPLVLTDVFMDDGTVGHSVVFTYTPAALGPTAELVRSFEALVKGDALAPADVEQKLARRFRLLGTQGLWFKRCAVGGALLTIGSVTNHDIAREVARRHIAGIRAWRMENVATGG